jgi:hypothetical protein
MSETKTRPNKLEVYNIRKGIYPVRVSLLQWPGEEPFIELYQGVPVKKDYKHSNFRIHSREIWQHIRNTIDLKLTSKLKKGKGISKKILDEEAENERTVLLKDNSLLKQKIKNFKKLVQDYRENNLPEYQQTLKEFESLLGKAKKESELQSFLKTNTWLLGLEYEHSTPQKGGLKSRYDFYVERYDGYADIVEIKKPSTEIFDKKGKLTKNFGSALQQLIEYIDEANYAGDSKTVSKKMEFQFLKPKGILIIGRTQDQEKLKNLKYYFHNIEILTFDDVLQRGKTVIASLQKRKGKRKKK